MDNMKSYCILVGKKKVPLAREEGEHENDGKIDNKKKIDNKS